MAGEPSSSEISLDQNQYLRAAVPSADACPWPRCRHPGGRTFWAHPLCGHERLHGTRHPHRRTHLGRRIPWRGACRWRRLRLHRMRPNGHSPCHANQQRRNPHHKRRCQPRPRCQGHKHGGRKRESGIPNALRRSSFAVGTTAQSRMHRIANWSERLSRHHGSSRCNNQPLERSTACTTTQPAATKPYEIWARWR